MSWLSHRNNVITLAIITAAFLFGLVEAIGTNVTINTPLFGIPIAYYLAVGQAYIAFAIIKRYM